MSEQKTYRVIAAQPTFAPGLGRLRPGEIRHEAACARFLGTLVEEIPPAEAAYTARMRESEAPPSGETRLGSEEPTRRNIPTVPPAPQVPAVPEAPPAEDTADHGADDPELPAEPPPEQPTPAESKPRRRLGRR